MTYKQENIPLLPIINIPYGIRDSQILAKKIKILEPNRWKLLPLSRCVITYFRGTEKKRGGIPVSNILHELFFKVWFRKCCDSLFNPSSPAGYAYNPAYINACTSINNSYVNISKCLKKRNLRPLCKGIETLLRYCGTSLTDFWSSSVSQAS